MTVFAPSRRLGVWEEPFVFLRFPKIFNLRSDPFEIAEKVGIGYSKWRLEHTFLLVPAQGFVAKFLKTFEEFPPRQKPSSFTIDQVMARLTEQTGR